MPPVEFEPTVSPDELPKTYALDRAATGTGKFSIVVFNIDQEPDTKKTFRPYYRINTDISVITDGLSRKLSRTGRAVLGSKI
jgi:hypothetical protein